MHDHDPRGAHFMVRTSPPQARDYIPNNMHHSKQQQHQQQSHHQHHHHHYQHQQQQQQQYQQHQHHHHMHQHQQQQQQQQYHHQPMQCQQEDQMYKKHPHESAMMYSHSYSEAPRPPPMYSEEEFEDVDEDQISDLDEEEELRLSYEQYRRNFRKQPDVTSQLLQFADMVSADIRKFFGRTKEQDDACDVYEDKWATTKSGRELYYADLLRIAQGDTEPVNKTTKKSLSSLSSSSSSSLSPHNDADNRSQFSGRRNISLGMGPLTELFEFGLHNLIQSDKKHRGFNSKSKVSTLPPILSQTNKTGSSNAIPMHDRNFPESFWKEPHGANGVNVNDTNRLEASQQNMLTSSKLPDFSDLVESWQGGGEAVSTVSHERGVRMEVPLEHHRL